MMKCVLALAMPQLVLWFLLTPALVLSQPVSDMAPSLMPTPPPDCPSMCGDVHIPFPFGIGGDCAGPGLDDFIITCNNSSNPPRAYLYDDIEIIDISVEAGELRVVTRVSYICYNSNNTIESNETAWQLNLTGTPFLISPKRNEFTAIGCNTKALLWGKEDGSYLTGCITTCVSLDGAAQDGEPCTGLGCCQMSYIPSNLSTITVYWGNETNVAVNPAWWYNPCSYAFVAEKDWYHFSRKDLTDIGAMAYDKRVGERSLPPLVLDWAITSNGTCPPPPPAIPIASACISTHSDCINVKERHGYLCNCSKGYSGNPYVIGGCTDINECEQYPCPSGSTCHNTDGDYKCKCHFWQKRDGKIENGCRSIFPAPVIATVATFCAIVVLVVLLWFVRREHKARQRRGFFDRNGGQILKSMNINLIPKAQLDKFTNNYSNRIGGGYFGEVFLGTYDNQQVAVKKLKRSMKVDEEACEKVSFVEEIKIQSQISHPNLVRLLGCCLDMEIPMLVFEFVPNGSLYDALHARGDVRRSTLSLPARLDIAIGSAEALAYMHSQAHHAGCKILHGDVKSDNILLDDNFQPKVSDFGLSKLLSSTDKKCAGLVIGDKGYIDPVYIQTRYFTEKSDVYSFGVVLLELITGKEARYNGNNSLPLDFKKSYEIGTNRAREMLDETFTSAADIDCLEKVGGFAVQCLKEYVDERPTMAQVVEYLEQVKMQTLAA